LQICSLLQYHPWDISSPV